MVSPLSGICAIGVMAKTPQPGRSKTRLCPPLQPGQAAALSAAFLRDTTENIAAARRHAPILGYAAYAPLGMEAVLRDHLSPGTALVLADGQAPMPPGVEGFGRCLLHAVQGMLALGHGAACVLSSDTPTLPTRCLVRAAELLLAPGAAGRAVLGACDDGGYYLLGVTAAHAELFADIAWSTDSVAEATRERVRRLGLDLIELDPWYDVDDAASLGRLLTDDAGAPAHWTQAALDQMGLRDMLAASAA
jgi:glycosyltransferase A (GT-A) superfamily protein (DUF2064 family)